jgi:hypothetical protein
MLQRAVKRGDDIPVDVLRVRRGVNAALLPDAVITWKLYDRTNTLVTSGNGTLQDASTAHFQLNVPKAITEVFELLGDYRLDIIHTYDGKQVTKSFSLKAVDNVP